MDDIDYKSRIRISLLARAGYSASVVDFLADVDTNILGFLARDPLYSFEPEQMVAWERELSILRNACRGIDGQMLLEFSIPRMGRRVDAVLVCRTVLFVIEFKVGERDFKRADRDQVWDYALDLKNFHEASHDLPIFPILVATEHSGREPALPASHRDGVREPWCTGSDGLRELIAEGLAACGDRVVCDPPTWELAPYHPTPTIIEAARALYANHSVEAIARNDAGARNLAVTSQRIEDIVDGARSCSRKCICFVTGVPGAGKTLVGLNVATRRSEPDAPTHATFLSGNGPLVAVLGEALTRDELQRLKSAGTRVTKGEVKSKVKAFIQNVHHFRDYALQDSRPPFDHVVIFDEAQRAWNRDQTSKFMRIKKQQDGFNASEPEFLLSYLDRHQDWAVVVCLVGGGQEINTGEAGIGEWIDAVVVEFPDWHVFISSELRDSEYSAGRALDLLAGRERVYTDESLHLAVSMRSFRADNVSGFVKALLDCERYGAIQAYRNFRNRYPLVLTRDLAAARRWIRSQARGSDRFGLVASSGAQRLKPHAIDVRVEIDPVHWFLNDREDTRSSYYLEDAATEFQVQGLELDWVCVTWDGDLRYGDDGWQYHSFRGSNWQKVHKADARNYLRNAYRVLLTRARQGMVIFVPEGDPTDPTRLPAFYDATFDYLKGLEIPVIE